jgi:hypothetical protein
MEQFERFVRCNFLAENPKTPAKLIKDFKKKLVKIKSVSKEHLSKVVCSSEKIN